MVKQTSCQIQMATPLSEVYRDTNHPLEHIIPLNFDSITELPESHVWNTTGSMPIQKHVEGEAHTLSVPIIDLRAPNLVELMKNASEKWGMFYVTNHGISLDLFKEVESHAQRLFDLPMEEKLKVLRRPNGATGYGVARISPFFEKLMWHEGFTVMGSPVEHAKQLWPLGYEEFCDAIDNYQKKMKSLACKILLIILKALEVDEDQEMALTASVSQSEGAFQLNSYPCCPNPSPAIGLAPHTDSSLLTILHQNDTSGLQLFRDDIGWMLVSPVPGALVVNLGDFLHVLSNARFKSALHRVIPNETKHRVTLAYFYSPSMDYVVAPLPNLPEPRFRPVTLKEFLCLKNKHFDKTIPSLMMN